MCLMRTENCSKNLQEEGNKRIYAYPFKIPAYPMKFEMSQGLQIFITKHFNNNKCGHITHVHCLMERLKKRWLTPRIEFGYLACVDCKQRIDAPHCP